jgi:hypothetical protein
LFGESEGKIVGHSVWHLSNTEELRKGELRDKEDAEALHDNLRKRRTLLSFMKSD